MLDKIWVVVHWEEIGPYWVVDHVATNELNLGKTEAENAVAEFKETGGGIEYWIGELHIA